MATRFIEGFGPNTGEAATELARLKAESVNHTPLLYDIYAGVLRFYDRVNSAARQLVTIDGTETLTGKTLTAPTITSPTVSGVITDSAVTNGPAPVAFASGTTLALTAALHAGKVVYVTDVAADYRLPAATGTGNKYTIVLGATQTGASTIKVNATPGTDIMIGTAVLFVDGGATVEGHATAADTDTIDLLGTGNSTGGMIGAIYEFIDIAAGIWSVKLVSDAAGTEATPFSASVP